MFKKRTLNRTKVINEAIAMMDRDGLAQLTLPRLAKQLNVRSQSLYNYVGNRQELIALAEAQLLDDLYQQVIDALVGLSGRQAILKFADIARHYLITHPSIAYIVYDLNELENYDQLITAIDRLVKLINQVLKVNDRGLPSTRSIVGAVLGFVFLGSAHTYRDEPPAVADREYHEMLLRLITPLEQHKHNK